jgi:hypothetical protein
MNLYTPEKKDDAILSPECESEEKSADGMSVVVKDP